MCRPREKNIVQIETSWKIGKKIFQIISKYTKYRIIEKVGICTNKIKFKNKCYYCDSTEKNEKYKGKIYWKLKKNHCSNIKPNNIWYDFRPTGNSFGLVILIPCTLSLEGKWVSQHGNLFLIPSPNKDMIESLKKNLSSTWRFQFFDQTSCTAQMTRLHFVYQNLNSRNTKDVSGCPRKW